MTCRAAFAVVVALAACDASLGGGGGVQDAALVDGRLHDATPIDASIDARPCTGGTMAQTAPDGSCLVFVNTPATYANARTACMAIMNGHLAYLKTAAIDTFAEAFIGAVDTWIGGNDLVTEMAFQWDDATAFSFTNWHTGEPNNGGTDATYQEDCVIVAGSRVGKQWDDRPCDASEVAASGMFAYLCQY